MTGIPLAPDRPAGKSGDKFKLGDFAIDEYRPIKVVAIGAGFSGIIAGIRFPQRIQNIDFTNYEKNAGVGGTWYLNKYPGVACDIPSHCYQLTFEENTDWSAFYSPGSEILAYLERVVDKYKLMRYIKLQHELIHARYDEPSAKWHLRLRRPAINSDSTAGIHFEEFEDTADILFTGLGSLSQWTWPDIAGLNEFKGTVLHTAQWDESVQDWGTKKVGVIGVGSSAIQIVPALQPKVAHLFNYVRGKTWIASPFAIAKLAALTHDSKSDNYSFTDADKKAFKDREYYKAFRHDLEAHIHTAYPVVLRGSALQQWAQKAFKQSMINKLEKKPWISDHLVPDFSVGCRRATPGPGYLDSLTRDNVDFISTPIKRITATGIETIDGHHQELDAIVCATGFDTTFQLPFPFIGRAGVSLQDAYKPHPITYLSVCVPGFPNWFQALGPNSAVSSGSLMVILERQIEYAIKATLKLQRERLKSIEVKKEAAQDYDEYIEHYFPTTVYSEKCRSWYKMGKEEGRVTGLWPGSCLHALRVLEHPRWEDFDYEPLNEIKNRFHWLGDGQTYNDKTKTGDRAWYLRDSEVDIPPSKL
ncbi:hypothetical protein PILCRDRAFT_648853 [Piloderma croceum F 1598]|uniref:FAD/NAD(P)-binding domain-containing protein n=1 Tax=Piloderma croceum (strain F 1598) TaxID=765440 RepID=A0A0C3EV48_PILCF|nr:hypothetical protein PILCRDRAFT_648853 [Piloderma croceum F 1598]